MKQLKVTLQRSLNGLNQSQKRTALCLGLRKIRQSRLFKDSPALRGQVKKLHQILFVEEV